MDVDEDFACGVVGAAEAAGKGELWRAAGRGEVCCGRGDGGGGDVDGGDGGGGGCEGIYSIKWRRRRRRRIVIIDSADEFKGRASGWGQQNVHGEVVAVSFQGRGGRRGGGRALRVGEGGVDECGREEGEEGEEKREGGVDEDHLFPCSELLVRRKSVRSSTKLLLMQREENEGRTKRKQKTKLGENVYISRWRY